MTYGNYGNKTQNSQYIDRKMVFSVLFWGGLTTLVLGGTIGGFMFIKPHYSVWSAQMQGEAEYAHLSDLEDE